MNPIAIRLLNQQLASPVFSDPADVVSHMGAIQAHNGIICGNWKPFGKKLEAITFTPDMPDMPIENINEAWRRYEQYQLA